MVAYAEDMEMASQWKKILQQDNIPAIIKDSPPKGIGLFVPEDYLDSALLVIEHSTPDLNFINELEHGDIDNDTF